MKRTILILALSVSNASVHAQELDYDVEVRALNTKIEVVRSRVCPVNGMTEKEVSQRYGRPRSATSPTDEKQNGNYAKEGLGLYRWFYEHTARSREQATGLGTIYPFEMVVYFIDNRVVGSTLEISPPSPRGYLSASGITTTYSGNPPVLRRTPDGKLVFDYHVAQGDYQLRKNLLSWLERYEALLPKATK